MGSEHLKKAAARVRKLAEAQELGKQEGDYKGQKRKPFEVSLKEHIGKFIDRLSLNDGLELTAVIGVTGLLLATPSFVEKTVEVVQKDWWLTLTPLFGMAGVATGYLLGVSKILSSAEKIQVQTDWKNVLVAFSIAYIIVHNFGLIVQTTGNIAKSIGTLGLALLG